MVDKIITNWKDIMMKIIVFFVTIFFLTSFSLVFKSSNAFIGITTIAIIMMLFDKDMADQPLSNSFKLWLLNILMVIAALSFDFNPSVFLILNFVVCFLIGYYFSYDIDKPIYIPFILQYLFLTFSVDINSNLIYQVVALTVGPFIFLLLQLIIKKRYPRPQVSVSLLDLSKVLLLKLDILLDGKGVKQVNQDIRNISDSLRDSLYDQQVNNVISTKDCIDYLNLSVGFEKISSIVEKANISKAMHTDLIHLFNLINDYFNNKIKINRVSRFINDYIKKYQTKNVLKERLELFNNLNIIKDRLDVLSEPEKQEEKDNFVLWLKKFHIDKYFDVKSLSSAFALKLASGVTLIYLISNILSLNASIWMILSFVLMINYAYEISNSKKIINALIIVVSSLLFLIIFNLINLPTIVLIIIATVFIFIINYINNSRVKLVAGGLLVIGAGFASNTDISIWLVILYLLSGSLMGTIFNIYFLPFKLKDQSIELKQMFYEVIKDMMQEIYNYINSKSKVKKGYYYMNGLYLTSSLILEQLNTYQEKMNIIEPNQQTVRRHLSADLYEFYLISDRIADLKSIKKQFNYIFKATEYKDLYAVKIENKNHSINDRLAIILLNNIIKELQYTKLKR